MYWLPINWYISSSCHLPLTSPAGAAILAKLPTTAKSTGGINTSALFTQCFYTGITGRDFAVKKSQTKKQIFVINVLCCAAVGSVSDLRCSAKQAQRTV